jgi:ArsR family transcriptional regulator
VRVHILDVLRRNPEPVCQCELIALFGIKQSLLSHHMRKLANARLVDVERRHKWAYYSVSPDALKELTSWLS